MSANAVALFNFPYTTPFLDKNGQISGAWQQALNQIVTTQNNQNVLIGGVSTAVQNLEIVSAPQAELPSNPPKGLVVEVSDYGHLLQWTGSAWAWGPGEIGSGYVGLFLAAPNTQGWHICDGSKVQQLNANGSTTQVALPDYATPAYLKLAKALAMGPNPATGITAPVSAGTPAGTLGVESADLADVAVTGAAIAAGQNHTHVFTGTPLGTHAHGPGTIDLFNTALLAYFRQ